MCGEPRLDSDDGSSTLGNANGVDDQTTYIEGMLYKRGRHLHAWQQRWYAVQPALRDSTASRPFIEPNVLRPFFTILVAPQV